MTDYPKLMWHQRTHDEITVQSKADEDAHADDYTAVPPGQIGDRPVPSHLTMSSDEPPTEQADKVPDKTDDADEPEVAAPAKPKRTVKEPPAKSHDKAPKRPVTQKRQPPPLKHK